MVDIVKFAAWTKDREALKAASSGGIFYELAKKFANSGGVVCGVVMEGLTPEFIMADNLEDVKRMRGSKYLWANPIPVFKNIAFYTKLEAFNNPILFVGLPCHILGLKRYLRNRGIPDKHITYVSLRCHGVIKTKTFQSYIKWMENIIERPITSVKFRAAWEKGAGLLVKGYNYQTKFFRPKLIKDYIKQRNVFPMCKTCTKDRNDSDITLGDFWGCHPALKNKYGTSVVETNTWKGYILFKSIAHKLHWNFVFKYVGIQADKDKIGLLKVADTKNFGNLMMSSNFMTYMKAAHKKAKFVFTEENSAQDIIEATTGIKDGIDYRSVKQSPLEFFRRLVNPEESNLVQTFADCKHVAILGGDYLTNKWKYKSWISNLVMLNALNKCGKHVYVISNTVGPFPFLLKPFVKFVFNNLKSIWCRDGDSWTRCCDIGVQKNVYYAPDLAFLPLHNELNYTMAEEIKKTYCTIVVSGLWSQYAHTYKEYVNGVKQMARKLYAFEGKDIIVLAHGMSESDIQLAHDVVSNEKHMSTPADPENATPSSMRNILGNSYLNVSFRMHGAISSLTKGVPVVAIAYSEKYKGVIADGYKLPELVVKKYSRKQWKKCIRQTVVAIQYALKYRNTLSRQIKKINEKTKLPPRALDPLLEIMEDT